MSQTKPTSRVVRGTKPFRGRQTLDYFAGISAESAGAAGICMHMVTIPPGGRAIPHLHDGHETAIFVISGEAEMWFGERLEHHLTVAAGDFLYIPAGEPHLPSNPHHAEPCVAILARTDPNEQGSVVLRPDLDAGGAVRTGRNSSSSVWRTSSEQRAGRANEIGE